MIKVQTCWDQLSPHVQEQITRHHPGVTPSSLSARLKDPVYWRAYERKLSKDEQAVLHWLCVRRGDDGLSFRDMQGGELPLPSTLCRMVITRLRQRGIVFAARKAWGEMCYVLPSDVRDARLRAIWPDGGAQAEAEAVELTHLAPPGLLHDVFHFLTMIEREGVSLTGAGKLPHQVKKKLNAELDVSEEAFAQAHWAGKEDEAVMSIDIAYRTAQRMGFLREQPGHALCLNESAVADWMGQSHRAAGQQLYMCVRSQWLEHHPRLAAVLAWMEQQKGWVRLRDMALFWKDQLGEHEMHWESFANEWLRICLRPWHACGWIDWGEDHTGPVWRWTALSPLGEAEEMDKPTPASYVQPNFEWLIPLHFPLKRRWLAAQFADLLQTDRMCTYDLNRASVKRGLRYGWTEDEMLQFIEQHSATPVPQNVAITIREWARRSGTLQMQSVLLLTCRDSRIAGQLSERDDVRPFIRRRVGETDFIVEEQAAERLLSRLNELEAFPVLICDSVSLPEAPSRENKGEHRHPPLKIENVYPRIEEAVPELTRLPKLWTSGWRHYHPSTLKALVRCALDLQLELEWEGGSGERRDTLRPTRLIRDADGLLVTGLDGRERVRRIPLKQLGRVRLRVPELD